MAGLSCGHFLIRPVFDTGAHALLPIARPVAEEFAIADTAVTVMGERRPSCASAYVRGPTSAIATLFCPGKHAARFSSVRYVTAAQRPGFARISEIIALPLPP